MLPYQSVAMDYAGYQRQPPNAGHMSMGLGMSVTGPAFTHSWLMPTQDLCAMQYNKLPNQHQNAMMQQQPLEPGQVSIRKKYKQLKISNWEKKKITNRSTQNNKRIERKEKKNEMQLKDDQR